MSGALIALLTLAGAAPEAAPRSVAFHYGAKPPLEALAVHDWVVLDPAAVPTSTIARRVAPAVPIAYVGVGEFHGSAAFSDRIDEGWVLGRNPAWGGRIMDLRSPEYRALLLEEVLPSLWARGFRGFFFDALDAHMAVLEGAEADAAWRGLVLFARAARERFPSAVLVANRGFEVLSELAPHVDAIAAESLFSGWDPEAREYRAVPAEDRAWLSERLNRARALGKVTISIDYVPPGARPRAREVAGRISDRGHLPWVAPAELDAPGVGALEVRPRKVLLLWDSKAEPALAFSAAHRFLAMPLEHLGLVPEYVDVRGALPQRRLAGEVAGVVSWLGGQPLDEPARLRRFLSRQVAEGVPLVMFGVLGDEANPAFFSALGLERGNPRPVEGLVVTRRSELLGFEAKARPAIYEMLPLEAKGEGFEVLLEVRVGEDVLQPILIAPWGGLALQPFFMAESFEADGRWILDPFRFLARALRLGDAPVVDPTTENGRRLLIAHVDGDGAASRAELPDRPFAIRAARERVLERYPFPHTVSVVEGELSPAGLHPELSSRLEREARRIFALSHVEPASHGFSHPFVWADFEAGKSAHLDVPGGTPSLEREIQGSLDYVSRLAGRPADIFLWTGDALPGPRALEIVEAAGARNLNGGFTVISDTRPSVTHVSPLGRPVGEYFQFYAPVLNENVFTEGWTGTFWGYRRARQTFARTSAPRRLTPLGIYWHFFSATKKAGLRALHQVYADALAREPLPVSLNVWIEKVEGQRSAVLAETLDGRFVVQGAEAVRTLRLPPGAGAVDLSRSEGVLGWRDTPAGRYVHLAGRRRVVLATTREPSFEGPRLVEASARVARAEREGGRLVLELEGPPPAALTVAGAECRPGPGRSTAGRSTAGRSTEGRSTAGRSTEGRSTEDARRYLLRGPLRVVCERRRDK